jgi:imidazolonepropionase-like amidohydrolase
MGSTTNLHEVIDSVIASGVRVDLPARMSFLPYTRNRVNIAAELVAAGCEKLILSPTANSIAGLRDLRASVSRLIAEGLDQAVALRAITLEPSLAVGQEEVMGTIAIGMPASFVIWSGDVFDPLTEVDSLVLDGEEKFNREQFESELLR